jgi:hypothetical protein
MIAGLQPRERAVARRQRLGVVAQAESNIQRGGYVDLPGVLSVLKASGLRTFKYTSGGECIEGEFGPEPRKVVPAGFVDADGAPVDLDAGMGVLEKDPLDDADPAHTANFVEPQDEPDAS